jgi:hypothetical protein
VHLGKNKAPILNDVARAAGKTAIDTEVLLLTDYPEDHREFPGNILFYDRNTRSTTLKRFIIKNRELQGVAGGYWLFSLERIFALKTLKQFISLQTPLIHFESDVLSLMDSKSILEICGKVRKTSVPRFSDNLGIGSVLVSPSVSQLIEDLSMLEETLISNPEIRDDMHLLGHALNANLIDELPSKPLDSQFNVVNPFDNQIFDGAAIGQYLLGRDPIHNGGMRASGYLDPNFGVDLRKFQFELPSQENSNPGGLFLSNRTIRLKVLNLHIHSKDPVEVIHENSEFWKRVIDAANNGYQLKSDTIVPDLIHSKRNTILNRFRLIRRMGLKEYLRQAMLGKGWFGEE